MNMIGELGEVMNWLRAAIAGWRFLISRSYRRTVMLGWQSERWFYIALDVTCGLAGIAFTVLSLIGLAFLIMSAMRE